MPLVDPVTQRQSSDLDSLKTQLAGKKFGETSDATTFSKQDLPDPNNTRVVEHGGMATMDVQPDRTNIHLGEDGTVRDIKKG